MDESTPPRYAFPYESSDNIDNPTLAELDVATAHSSSDADPVPHLPIEDVEKQHLKQGQDPDLVTWDGLRDPENPLGWTSKRKLFVSGVLVSLPLIVNVGTSILSAAGVFLSKEYHVGSEVTVLTTSLFLMVCLLALHYLKCRHGHSGRC